MKKKYVYVLQHGQTMVIHGIFKSKRKAMSYADTWTSIIIRKMEVIQ